MNLTISHLSKHYRRDLCGMRDFDLELRNGVDIVKAPDALRAAFGYLPLQNLRNRLRTVDVFHLEQSPSTGLRGHAARKPVAAVFQPGTGYDGGVSPDAAVPVENQIIKECSRAY